MNTPIVAINLKTYTEATGEKAVEIAKFCCEINKEHTAIACQSTDLERVSKTGVMTYAEHVDFLTPGSGTGWMTVEAVKEAGATGTILNHSEHRLSQEELEKCIERAKEHDFSIILCAKDDEEAEKFANLNVDFIAVEPPDMIGGDVSVTTKPELISDSVKKVKDKNPNMKILVGAGVKTKEDVAKAIELGAEGVLLASGVAKASDKKKVIQELVDGIK